MTIESATYLHDLNANYPANGDQLGEGDDHIKQIKLVLKNTFPGRAGAQGRAVVKNGAFTPATTENGCLFVGTAEITCTLPALAGVQAGTHFEFKALTNPLTLTPYSGEFIDQGGSAVLPTGGWAIVAKVDNTRWAMFKASELTASSITAALGATAVQNATNASNAGSATTAVNLSGGKVRAANGSAADSAIGFAIDTDTGFFWNTDGVLNVACNGAEIGYFNSTGLQFSGGRKASAALYADTVGGYAYNNLPYLSKDFGPIAVGMIAFGTCVAVGGVGYNGTIGGSKLWCGASLTTGTWRNINPGSIPEDGSGMFQRIS